MKRAFVTLFENESAAFEIPSFLPQTSRKKVKRALQIDIADSFPISHEKPVSTRNSNARKLSFSTVPLLPSAHMLKPSPSPRCSERSLFSMEPNSFFMENDVLYDDFAQEEGAFNITMKKCHRRRMEDRVAYNTGFDDNGAQTFFYGIYDGHRNSYVSDFLQRNLHTTIQSFPEMNSQPTKALKEAFKKIDQDVLKNQKDLNIQGGSTALCAFIKSKTLYLANVGDSKAVVIRNGQAVPLNKEHRATNEEERRNVEERGGFVFEKKGQTSSRFLVQGGLELTRSIGDPSYKEFITCEPDVTEYKFDKEDQYVIMASDGFWNEINEEETARLVKSHANIGGLSKFLVGEACKKKQYNIDNISMVAVDVQKLLNGNN